jgi:hypothetical protein
VLFAKGHLAGGKNGKPFGMKSNIAQKSVGYIKTIIEIKVALI